MTDREVGRTEKGNIRPAYRLPEATQLKRGNRWKRSQRGNEAKQQNRWGNEGDVITAATFSPGQNKIIVFLFTCIHPKNCVLIRLTESQPVTRPQGWLKGLLLNHHQLNQDEVIYTWSRRTVTSQQVNKWQFVSTVSTVSVRVML